MMKIVILLFICSSVELEAVSGFKDNGELSIYTHFLKRIPLKGEVV